VSLAVGGVTAIQACDMQRPGYASP
jgi:hypothetical protein